MKKPTEQEIKALADRAAAGAQACFDEGFDDGVMQALQWVLGTGEAPSLDCDDEEDEDLDDEEDEEDEETEDE